MSRRTELLEGVMNQLIDEEALGVCFEMHRAIKLGYYELLYPEESVYDKQPIVDVKGLDIFGNAPFSVKKSVDCVCPNCSRSLGAQKFAPHLEKCMGMGRNSTRLAAIKKPKTIIESEHDEGSEDNEEDWTYPESRKTAGQKRPRTKDKNHTSSASPLKSGRGPGRPSKQQLKGGREQSNGSLEKEREVDATPNENGRNVDGRGQGGGADFHSLKPSQQMHTVQSFKGLSLEHKVGLLDHICGVVSERTGRLCTRSVNCPQHSEEQRSELRTSLLSTKEKRSLEDSVMASPHKKAKISRKATPELSDDDGFKSGRNNHTHHESLTPKKKSKSSKRSRHGNSSHTTATVLHSSSSVY